MTLQIFREPSGAGKAQLRNTEKLDKPDKPDSFRLQISSLAVIYLV